MVTVVVIMSVMVIMLTVNNMITITTFTRMVIMSVTVMVIMCMLSHLRSVPISEGSQHRTQVHVKCLNFPQSLVSNMLLTTLPEFWHFSSSHNIANVQGKICNRHLKSFIKSVKSPAKK